MCFFACDFLQGRTHTKHSSRLVRPDCSLQGGITKKSPKKRGKNKNKAQKQRGNSKSEEQFMLLLGIIYTKGKTGYPKHNLSKSF